MAVPVYIFANAPGRFRSFFVPSHPELNKTNTLLLILLGLWAHGDRITSERGPGVRRYRYVQLVITERRRSDDGAPDGPAGGAGPSAPP